MSMKNIFSILALLLTISNINAGKIVLLRGTSCAGKSSLVKELEKLSEQNHGISDDEYFYRTYPNRWETLFPQEYKIIKDAIGDHQGNIVHAILWGKPLFKEGISDEQKLEAKQAIKKIRRLSDYPEIKQKYKMSEHILPDYHAEIEQALKNGKTVFIDSWWLKPEAYNKYKEAGHEVITVVCYCSLRSAMLRLILRNGEADQSKDNTDRRYVRQLLGSFYNDFKPVQEHEYKNRKQNFVLEVLAKEKLIEIFELAEDIIKDNKTFKNYGLFSRCELTKESLDQMKQDIINKFGFDKPRELWEPIGVAITYSDSFDFVIREENTSSWPSPGKDEALYLLEKLGLTKSEKQ